MEHPSRTAPAALLALLVGCSSGGTGPAQAPGEPRAAASQQAEEVAPATEETLPEIEELGSEPLSEVESQAETMAAKEPPLSGEEMLGQALEAYDSAETFWMEGSFDDAFAALDRSYELMSGVVVDGDPWVAQEKEDLRRLISQRIVEIYASQSTVVGEFNGSIPLETNAWVEREIQSFQGAERRAFLEGYERSGLYRPMLLELLQEAGMPEQLSWLPMVESWFKVRALSRARALGMWQFISSTGYRYGLKRTDWYDERMDPAKASRAALRYLGDLHGLFGDWLTAVAAYNCGEVRVQRIINQQRVAYFDRFWDLYQLLPGETRRYVPRFLATVLIVQDPERYGFSDLPTPLPAVDFTTIEVSRPVRLADLEKQLGLEAESLVLLNPELRHKTTPDERYDLKVPTPVAEAVGSSVAALPRVSAPQVMTSIHRVRSGETLSTIAQRYHTSVSSLMRLNGLRNANRIWPGQTLRVDGVAPPPIGGGDPTSYTVRPGDSLWRIARRFGTSVDLIQRENGLRGTTLRPGQQLRIRGGSAAGTTYVVRRGDTLSRIAQTSRVSVSRLAAANGLSLRSTIYPGQRLVIPN